MALLNFTLDYDFLVGLFSESKDQAYAKLMEAILNQVLQAESTEQLGAENYERSGDRLDYRNGTRIRTLTTRIGKIELKVPRHRNTPFKTVLFDNYKRNEQALIATMMEMVVMGVSTRKVQKVTEELCGESFSKSTVSEICKELDIPIKSFKERLLPETYPFVMVDAIYMKVREDHRVRSKALYVALGINNLGLKEIIGFEVYDSESTTSWKNFFESLKSRGLRGIDIIISDAHSGLVKAIKESFADATWQRCQVHLTRDILEKCPKKYSTGLASELRDMFNASTILEARRLKNEIIEEYQDVAKAATDLLDDAFEDGMAIMSLPFKYRTTLRSTNLIERENRELRRRENVISIFPNTESIIRLMGAVLHDTHTEWTNGYRVFSMDEYLDSRNDILKKLHKNIA